MPIEKRRNGSKNIDEYIADHEIKNDQIQNNKRTSSRNVKINKNNHTQNYEINNSRGHNSQLTGWVIAIGIVLVIFIIFTFSKFNTLGNGDNIQSLKNDIQALEKKVKNLEGEISTLKDNQWITVFVKYAGGSSTSNNVSWIGERSLGFPDKAKGKSCYIIGDKVRGEGGGSIGGYLGKNDDGSRYQYATMYEAEINNLFEKIEITKNGGNSNSNLTKYDRDNLYISFTMLCH